MLYTSLLVLTVLVVAPLGVIFSLWRKKHHNKFHWFLEVLVGGSFMIFIFIIGRWDWISYYTRFLWLILFIISAYKSFLRAKDQRNPHQWTWVLYNFFSLLILLSLNGWAFSGYAYQDKAVELSFPLKNGVYYIAHGGNNSLLNNHYTVEAQKYALDIDQLNWFGSRAGGLYPKNLNAYSIWETIVYSPCTGEIIESIDDLPDYTPPHGDANNPAGNHIVIECKEAKILLAHLQNGSAKHQIGTSVKAGDPLAKVGNSGNTSEPHLHIHAIESDGSSILEGKGIPMTFEGNFLTRNSLVFKTHS